MDYFHPESDYKQKQTRPVYGERSEKDKGKADRKGCCVRNEYGFHVREFWPPKFLAFDLTVFTRN